MAEQGMAGSCSIQIDDPDGDVGHNADAILGLKQFFVVETACAAGDQRLWTGYIGDRRYSRGPDRFRLGAGRLIDASLYDANAILNFRVFQPEDLDATSSFVRPAETDTQRIAALLAVDFLSTTLFDEGFIEPADIVLDPADYTGQRPTDVLNSMAQTSGCNYFVRYDEASGHLALHYRPNGSALDVATADISNVLADIGATVFTANLDWELVRDPSRVVAGVLLPYQGGNVYEQNINTSYIYGYRDMYAPAEDITTAGAATTRAGRYLTENATEDDRLSGTCLVPAADVNRIKAGQLLQVKFSHLPGYEAWRDCRVLRREVAQIERTSDYYTVRYELTPLPIPAEFFYALLHHASGFYGPGTPLYNPDGSEVVVWATDGDNPGSGWSYEYSSGQVEGIDGTASGWAWRGIRVLAAATVQIDLMGSGAGVFSLGDYATTQIRRNGTVIWSETFTATDYGGYRGFTHDVVLTGISAQAGDEFEVSWVNGGIDFGGYYARTAGEQNPQSHFRVTAQ